MQKSSEPTAERAAKDGEQTHENSPVNASQAASETHPGAPAAFAPQPSSSQGNRHGPAAAPVSCQAALQAELGAAIKRAVDASQQPLSREALDFHASTAHTQQQQQQSGQMHEQQALAQSSGYPLPQGQNQHFVQAAPGSQLQQQQQRDTRMLLIPCLSLFITVGILCTRNVALPGCVGYLPRVRILCHAPVIWRHTRGSHSGSFNYTSEHK